MTLPTLRSELDCLQNLHQSLQKRLSLESVYTTSLAAWLADALETGPKPAHALHVIFLNLFETTEKDIQSRRAMEDTFRLQIDRVLAAMESIHGHFELIDAHSKRLEEFDKLTRGALETRKVQYEEWEDWKSKPAPLASGRLLARSSISVALTDRKMVAAYDRADMQVRRHISKAEVARCSLKDKAIEEVEAISCAYGSAIDAITRCLWRFAKNQQDCASNASAGANMIVNVADDISGFGVANAFHDVLAFEALKISTASIPYEDLESLPNPQSQPIVLGFSLPPYDFSCTASTRLVINVFYQLVSFVHDHAAWDNYANQSSSPDYALARTFRDLERSWTKDEDLNRSLLHDLGPSTCATLVKTLLASFSEPLLDCSGDQRLCSLDDPNITRAEPIALVPFVPPLQDRPQGEMFRALCASLIPVFRGRSQRTEDQFSEIFSDLLTRKGECIKHVFPVLVREFSAIDTIIDTISALQRPLQNDAARSGGTTPKCETRAPNYSDEDNTATINDVESLKKGIIHSSKDSVQAQYTILLVGETGVGKSSFLDFITNVFTGNNIDCYDFTIHEQNVFGNQSQTDMAYFYDITSNNGVVVRILDISGLTDTRGLQKDEIHKKSMVTEIQKHLEFVSAILIVANGTVQRITAGMDYAFSTLSAILPSTMANNIAFLFTNVASRLSCNFPWDTVPEVFKIAPQFLLDNPVALQKKYLQFEDDLYSEDERMAMRSEVEAGQQRGLEMLVGLFDWLDGREPRPTTGIVYFHDIPRTIEGLIPNILAQMDRAIVKKAQIDQLMTTLEKSSADMAAFSNFERVVNVPAWRRQPTPTHNRQMSVDRDMKKKWEAVKNENEKTAVLIALNRMVLHNINQLSGSILEKLGSTARQLEQMHKAMEKKGVDHDLLQQVKESLDRMKRKLGL